MSETEEKMEVEEEVEKEVEEETSAPVRRSRRSRVSRDKQARHAALSELRSALSGKAQRIEQFELEEEEDVYDVVTEDQYKKLVNERRQGNDFVVDDDGLGYYDDGEEHLFDRESHRRKEISSQKAGALSLEAIKRARELDAKRKGEKQKLSHMFLNSANVIGPQTRKTETKSNEAADEFLDNMLDELEESDDKKEIVGQSKRNTSNPFAKVRASRRKLEDIALFTNNSEKVTEAHALPIPKVPEKRDMLAAALKELDDSVGMMDDDNNAMMMDLDDAAVGSGGDSGNVDNEEQVKREKVAAYIKRRKRLLRAGRNAAFKNVASFQETGKNNNNNDDDHDVSTKEEEDESVTEKLQTKHEGGWAYVSSQADSSSTSSSSSQVPTEKLATSSDLPLEDDTVTVRKEQKKYMMMYWTDVCSLPSRPDTLYLFGKVCTSSKGSKNKVYQSCCVKVPKLEYVIHVLPKPDTDMASTHEEINQVLQKLMHRGKFSFRSRAVKKRYAFELPDVPKEETEYLEVRYPASAPSLDPEISGKTFTRIFGTRTTGLEHFILERDLMGPGWIRVVAPQKPGNSFSWCSLEAVVDGPRAVQRVKKNVPPAPPLVVMSLSMKTVLDAKTNTHEVVMASALTHRGVRTDAQTEDVNALDHFTVVRPAVRGGMPLDLRAVSRGNKRWDGHLEITSNERSLLSFLVARVHRIDPDVIVGHNIYGFDLDVLLHRMKTNKVSQWSKLGRLRLSHMPKSVDGNNGITHFLGQLARGRLVCDTYLAARELIRETSYRLRELAVTRLNMEKPKDIQSVDVPKYYVTSKEILELAMHCENSCYLALRLMFKLEVIPLTHQVTGLAGNVWNRTLKGARAERIEYLLLHEFHRLGYVVPDKQRMKSKKRGGGRSKAAYAGGLVLEPKRGLYDSYVLLLDFNSLYPSIIREYNICFTTVDRDSLNRARIEAEENEENEEAAKAADELPNLPPKPAKGEKFAPLPSVIHHLVERRYVVKGMLKKEKNVSKRTMLDIRQKALKILANSMYGCLGFSFSRFYAKPLAALVTSLGRTILQNTVDLATQLGYDVIYGDTDSIMIHTNSRDLEEVRQIGNRIKKEVNKLYRLLEIEIDGVYKTMLLLKKKKYAALVVNSDAATGKITTTRELKGIDMVRRDWCPLSKEIGSKVLDFIMSGKLSRDDVVESIHHLLAQQAKAIRTGKVKLGKYIITKGLNKAPHLYPNASSQPHLVVALRQIAAGRSVNPGDHIPYVICKKPEDGVKQTPAQRARAPDEILRSRKTKTPLEVDYEWYLEHQILPPISRLCSVIAGTSQGNLAQAMGLNASKYIQRSSAVDFEDDDWAFASKSLMDDSERFKGVDAFLIPPRKMPLKSSGDQQKNTAYLEFRGLLPDVEARVDENVKVEKTLTWTSLSDDTNAATSVVRVDNQLVLQSRKFVRRYYEGCMQCDDAACGATSRHLRLASNGEQGFACVVPGCRGTMFPTYDAKLLFDQLQYFEALVDVPRAERKRKRLEEKKRRDAKRSKQNSNDQENTKDQSNSTIKLPPAKSMRREDLAQLRDCVHARIDQSAYNWIKPDLWRTVFS